MQNARWFTRGWTLQELLAPNGAKFFTAHGRYLGNKGTLSEKISSITRIPEAALSSQSLQSFSVEERLSWAQYRQTKREEDAAYSMLGIFGVSMPLVYGEGRQWAYHRLLKEVESRDKTRRLTEKYSQYLPVDNQPDVGKVAGEAEESAPRTDARSPSYHGPPTVQKGEMIWDLDLQNWTRVEWNPQYQMHCRKKYLEGA